VSVINPTTHAVSTITLGSDTGALAVSPTGPEAGDVYVTNFDTNSVTVIS
jgi:DNA-binding beta-propeller fold protein YncE